MSVRIPIVGIYRSIKRTNLFVHQRSVVGTTGLNVVFLFGSFVEQCIYQLSLPTNTIFHLVMVCLSEPSEFRHVLYHLHRFVFGPVFLKAIHCSVQFLSTLFLINAATLNVDYNILRPNKGITTTVVKYNKNLFTLFAETFSRKRCMISLTGFVLWLKVNVTDL